ncbi:hypothetical protein H1R20_g14273, partial [Candolleomyces eurysporus]
MTLSAPSASEITNITKDEKRMVYKGKATHRSWPQLPAELIRLIATFYLHNLSYTSYCPQTWEAHEFWQQRMVYAAVRDGIELERGLMSVCESWHRALENHFFWQQSVNLIDPLDLFAPHMVAAPPKPTSKHGGSQQAPTVKITYWKHLRNILSCSCIVCRINQPLTNIGLGNVQHTSNRRSIMYTPYIGMINVCRDHEKRKTAFCGLCLRESPNFDTGTLGMFGGFGIACLDNEDEDTWPNVEATCKNCRLEWLWRKAWTQPIDREAIGGPPCTGSTRPTFLPIPHLQTLLQNTPDWETRHTLEGFVEMAEGTIPDVLSLAREKWWLRKFTKLGDMMMQAVAARRWVNGGGESATAPSRSTHHEPQQQQQQQLDLRGVYQIEHRKEEEEEEASPEEVQKHGEEEKAQLAMDLELAVRLEKEDRDREEGEYVQRPKQPPPPLPTRQTNRARTPSPPAERVSENTYEPPLTIQFASDTYSSSPRTTITAATLEDADLERFDDRDEVLSQADDLSEEEEEEEEEEEDTSILQTEENSVRELALGDWARARILDGYWVSPADVWYGYDKVYKGSGMGADHKMNLYPDTATTSSTPGEEGGGRRQDKRKEGWTLAVHPCPWTIEAGGQTSASDLRNGEQEESHPHWETVVSQAPPTFALCEQAYQVHQKQLRQILLPAMRNVVRKIVMDCGVAALPKDENDNGDRARASSVSSSEGSNRKRKRTPTGTRRKSSGPNDPAVIASRMTIEEVVKIMREEEGVWFEGVDWVERKRNEREAAAKRKRSVPIPLSEAVSGGSPNPYPDNLENPNNGHGPTTTEESPPKKRRKTKDGEDSRPFGGAGASQTTALPSSTSTSPNGSEGVEEDVTSSGSGTSPVLSTSTLQTTPSPPPSTVTAEDGDQKGDAQEDEDGDEFVDVEEEEKRIRIPVAPVLERPRLLRPIPYIPLTVSNMPQYTLRALEMSWREASNANASANGHGRRRSSAAAETQKPQQQQQQQPQPQQTQTAPPSHPPPPLPTRPPPGVPVQHAQQKIPAIRLRPVAAPKAELPQRQQAERQEEEEEEEETLSREQVVVREVEVSDEYDDEEFERLIDERDLDLDDNDDLNEFDGQYEQVPYGYGDADDDEVVEIDLDSEGVEAAFEATKVTTANVGGVPCTPTKRTAAATTTSVTSPTRTARKRSCDEEELELDHEGRTVSIRSVSAGSEDLGNDVLAPSEAKYGAPTPRSPTPPKRQKMAGEEALSGNSRG